jgi:predicted N-acetyltransferase YhbS
MSDSTSSTVTVRDARPEDDRAIGELLVEAFVTTYAHKMPHVVVTDRRKADLRAVAEKRRVAQVWVAEVDGEVAGTVSLWPAGASGSEAFVPKAADLRHLAVSPRHHGKGVSSALMDAAEKRAWSLGADAICLHVRRGAEGVGRLYSARGYQRRPEGDIDHLPEVFLEGYVLPRPR